MAFLKAAKANIDVVKIEWLKGILDAGIFTMYKPHEAVCLSERSLLRYKQFYDKYNDSYKEPVTEKSLEEIFNNVEKAVSNQSRIDGI